MTMIGTIMRMIHDMTFAAESSASPLRNEACAGPAPQPSAAASRMPGSARLAGFAGFEPALAAKRPVARADFLGSETILWGW
ncbi:MAG TPA: hypothetical protein VIH15_02260 [Casimicrobiaceae bacterium]